MRIADVLLQDRPVQAQLWGCGPPPRGSPITEGAGPGRRDQVDHQEGRGDQDQQGDHQPDQPPPEEHDPPAGGGALLRGGRVGAGPTFPAKGEPALPPPRSSCGEPDVVGRRTARPFPGAPCGCRTDGCRPRSGYVGALQQCLVRLLPQRAAVGAPAPGACARATRNPGSDLAGVAAALAGVRAAEEGRHHEGEVDVDRAVEDVEVARCTGPAGRRRARDPSVPYRSRPPSTAARSVRPRMPSAARRSGKILTVTEQLAVLLSGMPFGHQDPARGLQRPVRVVDVEVRSAPVDSSPGECDGASPRSDRSRPRPGCWCPPGRPCPVERPGHREPQLLVTEQPAVLLVGVHLADDHRDVERLRVLSAPAGPGLAR